MYRLKHITKQAVLLIAAFVLVGAAPITAYAEGGDKEPQETYQYDSQNEKWNGSKWVYDAPTKSYIPTPAPAPTPTQTTPSPDPTPVKDESTSTEQTPQAAGGPSSSGSGKATTEATQDINQSSTVNNNTNANNNLDSHAKTGDASVTKNTKAGGAATGNASAETTVINTVHSTIQGDTAGIAHFTADINGDVVGDIMLYPAIEGATTKTSTTVNSGSTVNNTSTLTNNIDLGATSGNALVNGNTEAGDATSGNANTVANVVNLINTIISANKSFVGTINIYGNLDGDILISPEFIPQLLGSNASTSNDIDTSLSSSLNSNQQIINNIKLNAETGNANVANNTNAGSATTGEAETNLTVLNLTGREVNASNSLLVFVNVLGTWVGMIVDAPGATAAALGSGVIENKTVINGDSTVNDNASITNNITLTSNSGNADVTGNTTAGGAKTGNATASANIANISTTKFKLSDWFGVLFINVYGKWVGSFGVNTEAGNRVTALGGNAAPPPDSTALGAPTARFGFIPGGSGGGTQKINPLFGGTGNIDITGPSQAQSSETPQITPAEAEQIKVYMQREADAAGQENTAAKTKSVNDMTNAVMMAVGSVVTLAGATTAATGGKRHFFGHRNRG